MARGHLPLLSDVVDDQDGLAAAPQPLERPAVSMAGDSLRVTGNAA